MLVFDISPAVAALFGGEGEGQWDFKFSGKNAAEVVYSFGCVILFRFMF